MKVIEATQDHRLVLNTSVLVEKFQLNPFTPKSDQYQISPPASPVILHHTVWRTWLFIAYSDERWLYHQFSLPHSHISFKKGWESVTFDLSTNLTCGSSSSGTMLFVGSLISSWDLSTPVAKSCAKNCLMRTRFHAFQRSLSESRLIATGTCWVDDRFLVAVSSRFELGR